VAQAPERKATVAAIANEADSMVKDFTKGSAERASEVATMVRDLAAQAPERKATVATIANEADTLVKDFAKGSAQLRSEVKAMLDEFANGDAERKSEMAAVLSDFAKGDTERASEVASMLRDFAAQSPERKATVAAIANEADTLVKDFTKGSAQRCSDVATMIKDLANGSTERHTEVWGKAPARKMAVPPVEELPEEMPLEAPPVVAEKAPVGELRDRVFAYLADHPDGTRLVELEEEFGVARIQAARVVRELMDDNKVEKRDLLYFAI